MKKVLLVAVSVLLVCTSCVTKKKYLLAENGRLEAIARGDDLQNQLVNCRDNNDGLTSRLASLERDTTRMGKNIRNYQSMLNTNMTEQEKLNSLLSQKMNELDERERTINELQDMINAQTERVQNLLNSVKDALLGFSSDELTVREKDGKVYVAMSDKLLFESGSARVDKRGKEALAKRFIGPNRAVGRKGRERRSAPGIEVCPSERRFNAGQGFRMTAQSSERIGRTASLYGFTKKSAGTPPTSG